MPTRLNIIERVRRHVYGEQPSDDAAITENLVNAWMNDGIAIAAKQNWKESIQLDGVSYVNNSFYCTYRGIPIVQDDEQFLYTMALPQIPLGLGRNEGISVLQVVSPDGTVSDPLIPISEAQFGYMRGQRKMPNKIMYLPEGTFCHIISTLQLFPYTGKIRMISGGDRTDLNSIVNLPDESVAVVVDYCSKMLMQEVAIPKDLTIDGRDDRK